MAETSAAGGAYGALGTLVSYARRGVTREIDTVVANRRGVRAVKAALDKVAIALIDDHVQHCVADACAPATATRRSVS